MTGIPYPQGGWPFPADRAEPGAKESAPAADSDCIDCGAVSTNEAHSSRAAAADWTHKDPSPTKRTWLPASVCPSSWLPRFSCLRVRL